MNDLPISGVSRPKDAAGRFYDRLSRWYDLLAEGSERRAREIALALLDAHTGESILEIGSGTGNSLSTLALAVGEEGKICGLDLSLGMLITSKRRICGRPVSHIVRLIRGDGAQLPFATGSFDSLLMSFTLELFDTPDIPIVLDECQRVLRGRGRLCIAGMASRARRDWLVRLYEWAHSRFPVYLDCRPIPVERVTRECGFKVEAVRALSMWGLPVEVVLARR